MPGDWHATGGAIPTLTAEQAAAVDGDHRRRCATGAFAPFLLHGVTGSGKTEVYLRVIADGARARARPRSCSCPRSR